jgi:transcription-repair coupling factor (superfamily II helicase)
MVETRIIHGVPEGQDAFTLKDRAVTAQRANGGIACHIAMDDARAQTLQDLLSFFAPEIEVIYFPAWDCLPYDRVSPSTPIIGQRMKALSALKARMKSEIKKPCVLITTMNAILRQVIAPDALSSVGGFSIEKGGRLDDKALQSFLSANGYERTETIRETGEFAIRGGIIDIWPATFDTPIRIDLFGDEVESLKEFDPVSQKSEKSISSLSLNAATEIPLDEASIKRFRTCYRELFGAVNDNDPLYEAVTNARRIAGIEHWQPLFFEEMVSLTDYLPDAIFSLDHQGNQAMKEAFEQIQDFYQSRMTLAAQAAKDNKKTKSDKAAIYHPVPIEMMFVGPSPSHLSAGPSLSLKGEGCFEMFSPFPGIRHSDRPQGAEESVATQSDPSRSLSSRTRGLGMTGVIGKDFSDVRAMPDGNVFAALKAYIGKHSEQKAIINAYSEGSRERLKGLLEAHEINNIKYCESFDAAIKLKSDNIALILLPLERGFVNERVVVISEQDILGDRLVRKSKSRKKKSDAFLREVSSLSAGDYVVHLEHGIGRFEGLETITALGAAHDCVRLVYDGGDKLFVPVENIEVLSRYGDADAIIQLDKLGGAGWQARRAKVKKNLLEMAGKLIDIAAARALQKADIFQIDEGIYNDFAARFPFHETEDQQGSIDAVIEDLKAGKPMDRLVCGDVGFGKTEVAIRAAYVTAMAGGQVAIIAPTTLLARQHYENFVSRFKGTDLRIEQLSRLVTPKNRKEAKEGIANGSVNIVIGTHALLADSLKFNHLGLVIVDEEQRFGVKQKERLKDLKKDVHVLTLTATPIPRTLQMSLTGVRDLSLITTPPVDRLAIRSFVMPWDPLIVKEALLREHHRGGQSFVVCPRVKDIKELEERIKDLVPEVKTIVAHGQLSPSDLEDRMTAFYEKRYDVLIATNIIESGIDVASANTMIVHRSDMFGMAQLYQIRGRIGRSKIRAYAYLTYQQDKKLSDIAMKRLEIIGSLNTLGAGFQLASHDMDLRGAGNLVGEQQSGHIREVGVELYQQMLEEAVAQAKEGNTDIDVVKATEFSPEINLGTSILIPENYVPDLSVRMSLYRRIASLGSRSPDHSTSPPPSGDRAQQTPAQGGGGDIKAADDFSNEIESFAAELIDRFGAIPDEVENLLKLIQMKRMCKTANISHVDAGPKGLLITYHNNKPQNPSALMAFIQEKAGTVKLRPDQKLFFPREWASTAQRMKGTKATLKALAELD